MRKNHVVRPLRAGFGTLNHRSDVVPRREQCIRVGSHRGDELFNDGLSVQVIAISMERKHEVPAIFGATATKPHPHDAIGPYRHPKFAVVAICIDVESFGVGFIVTGDCPVRGVIGNRLGASSECVSQRDQRIGIKLRKRWHLSGLWSDNGSFLRHPSATKRTM